MGFCERVSGESRGVFVMPARGGGVGWRVDVHTTKEWLYLQGLGFKGRRYILGVRGAFIGVEGIFLFF
jgi:hypothetical protein